MALLISWSYITGQVCNRKGSLISTCKSIKDCPKAVNDLKTTGKQVTVCHFEDEHPVICCEPDEPGTKSKKSKYDRTQKKAPHSRTEIILPHSDVNFKRLHI